MTLELRELNGTDLFPMLKIVGKLDIKDEVASLFNGSSDAVNIPYLLDDEGNIKVDENGTKLIDENLLGTRATLGALQAVMTNLEVAKSDINTLLARLAQTDPQTIESLGFAEYTELLTSFFKKPELTSFFKSIASLM